MPARVCVFCEWRVEMCVKLFQRQREKEREGGVSKKEKETEYNSVNNKTSVLP
jgi:hypothetical protein